MGNLTLADFLNENTIPEIQLLTKPKDFNDVIIEYISVQELPAEKFIDQNELVLTTGIGCRNEDTFLRLIQELSRAAAAFLTFQDETFSVPDSVIRLADQYGLPLFRIPWEYRFSDIQSHVLEKIQEKQLGLYQDLQTELCNLFFEGRSLHDAAALIENTLRHPVSIVDQNYRIQSVSSTLRRMQGENAEVEKLPICTGNDLLGYLIFYPSFLQEPSFILAKESVLSRFVCFPLSLWFNRKNTEDMLVTKLKNDFVMNLANGNYTSIQDMVIHGNRLHFDLTRPYTCIILKAVTSQETAALQQYSNEAAVNTTTIETFLILTGKKQQLKIMVADQSLEFIIYVENKGSDPVTQVDQFIDILDSELKRMFPDYRFYWGISEISMKAPDYRQLYKNAAVALQHSLNSNRKRYRCDYQDTKEAQIISILSERREISELIESTIGALKAYDADSSMDLLGTLMEFIKCNYNISKTARNLHIHRQSLLYRMEKIEELTEMSLSHHRDLFLLEVCARVLIGDGFY